MESLVNKENIRNNIVFFESELRKMEGAMLGDSAMCPLKHSFSDGMYVREIFIPAGTFIVGKIHKHDHPNFLLRGTVDVVTEEGRKTLEGPLSMISPAGTKRALYATTDIVWVTVHKNDSNTQDLNKLEKEIIAESYEDYEEFRISQSKKSSLLEFGSSIKNYIKRRLK